MSKLCAIDAFYYLLFLEVSMLVTNCFFTQYAKPLGLLSFLFKRRRALSFIPQSFGIQMTHFAGTKLTARSDSIASSSSHMVSLC